MIPTLLVIALAMGFLYFVLQPVRRGAVPEDDTNLDLRDELFARKRAALGAILDIETERDTGKLSSEDFAILRREYEAEAIDALRELDSSAPAASTADLPDADDELEAEIAALRSELVCPSCGAARPRGERCPRCGAL